MIWGRILHGRHRSGGRVMGRRAKRGGTQREGTRGVQVADFCMRISRRQSDDWVLQGPFVQTFRDFGRGGTMPAKVMHLQFETHSIAQTASDERIFIMRLTITSGFPTERSDIPELQVVITHCVDSFHDYSRAAGATNCPDLAARLAGAAADRREAGQELARMIRSQGGQPRQGPSLVGTLRRAWGGFIDKLGASTPAATVAACLRGERGLLNALEMALDSQEITSGHAAALRRTRQDITATIRDLGGVRQRSAFSEA